MRMNKNGITIIIELTPQVKEIIDKIRNRMEWREFLFHLTQPFTDTDLQKLHDESRIPVYKTKRVKK